MEFEMPETLEGLGRTELTELVEAAKTAFRTLYTDEAGEGNIASEEGLAKLTELGENIDALEDSLAVVVEAEGERAAKADALAEKALGGEDEDGEDDPDEPKGAEQTSEDDDKPAEDDDSAEAEAEAKKERELVTASAKRRKTSFRSLKDQRQQDQVPDEKLGGYLMAASVPGHKDGHVSSVDLAEAFDRMASGSMVRSMRQESYGTGKHASSLGTLSRNFPERLTGSDRASITAALDEATNERNLPGNSLTAASGWCAPSETVYDFLALPRAGDFISVPEITINRGGIQFPVQPDFGMAFAEQGFLYTEAEWIVNEEDETFEKPCFEVPCPGFEEIRLSAIGLCITAGILQQKGFPEAVRVYIDGIMQAHQHRINSYTINAIVAGSTAVTIPAGTEGAWASLLNSIELAIVDTRTRQRIASTENLEVILPVHAKAILRADLSARYKIRVDELNDAALLAHFALRGAAVQFVSDWQVGDAGQPGADTPITSWPETIKFVVYPAGTWFRSMQDVIEVGNLYDQAQLKQNRFTALFTEDAIAVGKRGIVSRIYTVPTLIGEQTAIAAG